MQKQTIQVLSATLFFGLLVWGVWSTIVYFGTPYHFSVLADPATKASIVEGCGGSESWTCIGFSAIGSAFRFTLSRGAPFLWYVVLSLLAIVAVIGVSGVRTGVFAFRLRATPWKITGLFLVALWLFFTTLSNGSSGGMPLTRVVEPTAEVYPGVSESVLNVLRENLLTLDTRGCLKEVGTFSNGARVYELKERCIQLSFLTRVVPAFLVVLLFVFEVLVAGRMLLHLLRIRPRDLVGELLLSIGGGIVVWVVLLWSLAVAGFFVMPAGWVLLALIPLAGFRSSMYWIRTFFTASVDIEWGWRDLRTIVAWLLLSYLALNFLTVIRPFPIGWDDLGSYLNRPRLLVSYGGFIYSMASFQWEYLSALGYLLFGYAKPFGATAAMVVNWAAGLFAVVAVYGTSRTYLGRGYGLLAALLYYTLPLVGHFSFADMKIDNGVFLMGALGMYTMFRALFPPPEHADSDIETVVPRRNSWIALAGIFLGLAFAMKPTAIMVYLALGALFVGVTVHWTWFFAAVFASVALYAYRYLNVTQLSERLTGDPQAIGSKAITLIAGILALLFLVHPWSWKARHRIVPILISCAVFAGSFFLMVAPWILHNNVLNGYWPPVFVLGAPNPNGPILDIYGNTPPPRVKPFRPYRGLPEELQLGTGSTICGQNTSGKEELDRYWGYRQGISHYLTLPWRSILNLDSVGYYVTTSPALFLVPLVLLLPFFWTKKARWLRWLLAGTVFIVIQWVFLANGILWYGIGMFLGLVVAIEALVARSPDIFSRTLASILIALSLLATFGMRFWQFEQQRNILEYAFGKISAEALQERTISHYDDIADSVMERSAKIPDRPYLYRIGTFIPYFIPRNLEIIAIADNQLDFFNCLFAERDASLTLKRLQHLGFNSIVFDTNTATIEKDPEGSLHQKVRAFLEFVNTPGLGLNVPVNDPDSGIAYIILP